MYSKNIEQAKQLYKEKTGLKRLTVKPIILKGFNEPSKVTFLVNGKRRTLMKIGNVYEFINLRG